MKLVIDISEERYKDIRDYIVDKDCCHALDSYDLREIIRNGTPIEEKQTDTAECFTLEELESWLWQNVLNNSDNAYGESVETLIGRLDGFKRFVEDSRMKGVNQ